MLTAVEPGICSCAGLLDSCALRRHLQIFAVNQSRPQHGDITARACAGLQTFNSLSLKPPHQRSRSSAETCCGWLVSIPAWHQIKIGLLSPSQHQCRDHQLWLPDFTQDFLPLASSLLQPGEQLDVPRAEGTEGGAKLTAALCAGHTSQLASKCAQPWVLSSPGPCPCCCWSTRLHAWSP